jgi:hypothetical protein
MITTRYVISGRPMAHHWWNKYLLPKLDAMRTQQAKGAASTRKEETIRIDFDT